MQNYQFKLTPAYCLYNGAAVLEQHGAYIKFITESLDDSVLQKRLEKAFTNYVSQVVKQKDCDPSFKEIPDVQFVTGTHEEIRNCVSHLYREGGYENIQQKKNKEEKEKNEAAAVLLLDSILNEARKKNVTDIHIEKNFVRIRINGKLENYASIQKDRNDELILRIKLLAGMNVLEKRKCQDGHFVYGENNPLFVRVSVMGIVGDTPDENDESVVMRLLDTKRIPLGLVNLGFSSDQLFLLENLIKKKNGLILICGPTGSGKSTTAASLLIEIFKYSGGLSKIISFEDPPEYVVPGVTQVKIDEKNGISFATALENSFRQDPDVMMIGEVRDEKSAMTALRASMTGHLVIATLHTDSVASSFFRLVDLGCSELILPSVIRGVVMQELQYQDGVPVLLSDVALPGKSFNSRVKNALCADEVEEMFEHKTNVPELISRELKQFKKKQNNLSFPLSISKRGKAI